MSEETKEGLKYFAKVGIPAGIVFLLLAAAVSVIGSKFGQDGQITFLFGFVVLVVLAGLACFVIERMKL